jgi:hypothetical protein
MSGMYLGIRQDRFLPHPLPFINHPTIRRWTVWRTKSSTEQTTNGKLRGEFSFIFLCIYRVVLRRWGN